MSPRSRHARAASTSGQNWAFSATARTRLGAVVAWNAATRSAASGVTVTGFSSNTCRRAASASNVTRSCMSTPSTRNEGTMMSTASKRRPSGSAASASARHANSGTAAGIRAATAFRASRFGSISAVTATRFVCRAARAWYFAMLPQPTNATRRSLASTSAIAAPVSDRSDAASRPRRVRRGDATRSVSRGSRAEVARRRFKSTTDCRLRAQALSRIGAAPHGAMGFSGECDPGLSPKGSGAAPLSARARRLRPLRDP